MATQKQVNKLSMSIGGGITTDDQFDRAKLKKLISKKTDSMFPKNNGTSPK